jgi:hypothetical protein
VSPYDKGYNEAVTELLTVAYFFFAFWAMRNSQTIKRWNSKIQLAWLLGTTALVALAIAYLFVPLFHWLNQAFSGE